jgi:hypothetical protein
MKSLNLKSITALFIALTLTSGASVAFAQDAPQAPAERSGGAKSDAEFKSDYQAKMAKFDQHYQKLKQKEASTNDPAMKADIQKITTRMEAVKADMSRYEANSAKMSDQEKEQARTSIKNQMNEIKQMNDAAMAKYGKSGKQNNKGQSDVQQGGGDKNKEMQKEKAREEMKGEKRNKKESEPK